jgi:hypothetical protein
MNCPFKIGDKVTINRKPFVTYDGPEDNLEYFRKSSDWRKSPGNITYDSVFTVESYFPASDMGKGFLVQVEHKGAKCTCFMGRLTKVNSVSLPEDLFDL